MDVREALGAIGRAQEEATDDAAQQVGEDDGEYQHDDRQGDLGHLPERGAKDLLEAADQPDRRLDVHLDVGVRCGRRRQQDKPRVRHPGSGHAAVVTCPGSRQTVAAGVMAASP